MGVKGRQKAAHIHAVFLKPWTTAEKLKRNEVLTYTQVNHSMDFKGREKAAHIYAMFLKPWTTAEKLK